MKKPTRLCVTFPHEMVRTIKRIARTEKVSLAEAVRILVGMGAIAVNRELEECESK